MNPEKKLFSRRGFIRTVFYDTCAILLSRSLPPPERPPINISDLNFNPHHVNFLDFPDVHHGLTNTPDGRQYNTQVIPTLEYLAPYLTHLPVNKCILSGDIIREIYSNLHQNEKLIRGVMDICYALGYPLVLVPGNHDYWAQLNSYLAELSHDYHLPPVYGVESYGNWQHVWLDFEFSPEGFPILSPERISWLKDTTANCRSLITTHHNFFPIGSPNNPYFGTTSASALANGPAVWQAIKHNPIMGVISGHAHEAKVIHHDGVPFIFLPAFVENLPFTDPRLCPGIITKIAVVNSLHYYIQSFYGSTCIFNFDNYRSI